MLCNNKKVNLSPELKTDGQLKIWVRKFRLVHCYCSGATRCFIRVLFLVWKHLPRSSIHVHLLAYLARPLARKCVYQSEVPEWTNPWRYKD